METTTAVLEREETSERTTEAPERRRSPLGLMAAGIAVIGLAVGLLVTTKGRTEQPAPRSPAAEATTTRAQVPAGLTIQSPGDISVLNMTYEPGQSSGWHSHRGIHAVALVSGQITVYDQSCQAHTYGPGDAYIGGQQLHLVRNEGAEPAVMVVTYVNPVSQGPAQVATAAPVPPCDIR
jgi:quercetin dioxygenase-like cupin family protein